VPFTLSHPAAVVPLWRTRLPLSALIVGSISPDFIFFIRLMPPPRGHFSHTIPGLLTWGLPAALVLLVCFHLVLKWPLVSLAPARYQSRLVGPATGFRFGPPARFGAIVAAILIGGSTHLVWDDFTHGDGRLVAAMPLLGASVAATGSGTILVFHVLQYLSTLLGALLLVHWVRKWASVAPELAVPGELRRGARYKAGWAVTLILGSVALVALKIAWEWSRDAGVRRLLVGGVVTSVTALSVLLVVFATAWHLEHRYRPLPSARSTARRPRLYLR
jgi:hypothetical protein